MMPHVSTTVKRSPTITVLRSVFQKHLIGSVSTSPGCRTCGTGLGGAFDAGLAGCATAGDANTRRRSAISLFICLLEFAEPPLFGELDQRRFHFPAVEADADQIEIVVAGEPGDVRLPFLDAVGHARELPA